MPLSDDDILKYKALYLQTARNYLQNMQSKISFLLKGGQSGLAVKQAHIDAHSLKSQSQLMGYSQIARIAELMEQIFNKHENSQIKKEILIQIQADLTRLHDCLQEIEKNEKELDLSETIKKLEKL